MNTIRTTCTRDCPGTCGLLGRAKNGRLAELRGDPEHPLAQGAACAKATRYPGRVNHPDRLLHPLLRSGGGWSRICWDEALDAVAARLEETIRHHGPEAVLNYQGYGQRTGLMLLVQRFFADLGGVTGLRGSLCGGTGQAAQEMDVGSPRVSHDPADLENAASIVLWGRNPAATQPWLARLVRRCAKAGARVLLVDPLPSETATLAEKRIAPRPGGDLWLALGAALAARRLGGFDMEFIGRRSEHFAAYEAILAAHTEAECAARAGVGEGEPDMLARAYLERPCATLLGWGLHRHEWAHQAVRAIDALGAATGNLGLPGGGVSQGFEEYGPFDPEVAGMGVARRRLLMPRIGRELVGAAPRVRMICVTAANPLAMAPDTNRVAEGFARADFRVYIGHFPDDTARASDLLLPATMFPEELDVVASFGHNHLGPVNPVSEPRGECRPACDMFRDLARRMGLGGHWGRSRREWLRELIRPAAERDGFSLEDVLAGPVRLGEPVVPYRESFPSPTGRFRFLDRLEEETEACDPGAYPLRLLSPGDPKRLNSEAAPDDFQGLPELRVHPEAAHGLADGAEALAVSPVGELRVRVRLDEGLRTDTAVTRRGGWAAQGHGINLLTVDVVSRAGEGTAYYATRIRLEKAD